MDIFSGTIGTIFGLILMSAPWIDREIRASRQETKSWLSVQGRIIVSEPATKQVGHSLCPSGKLKYTYSVEGSDYLGCHIEYGDTDGDRYNEVPKYPVGLKVSVIYDPRDPSKAALRVSDMHNQGFTASAIAGTLAFLFGLLIFLVAWRLPPFSSLE